MQNGKREGDGSLIIDGLRISLPRDLSGQIGAMCNAARESAVTLPRARCWSMVCSCRRVRHFHGSPLPSVDRMGRET